MKTNKWDTYFMSHYRPEEAHWSNADLSKYRQWYTNWITYIEQRCDILKEPCSIFEIGSGIGATASLLSQKGHSVTGSDISHLMVDAASQFCNPIPFIFCDIQKKIPSKTKFDVILAFEVLEHVKKLESAIKNIYSSLRKGGYFIGSTPYPYPKNFIDPTHVNVKYPEEWNQIFLDYGFTCVTLYPMSFLPYFWRIHKFLNPVMPFYTPIQFIVSTTLIIAKK